MKNWKMHSANSRNREEDCKYVMESCRNLVHTEIKTLRDNLGSLRGFLRGCQETINSETAKLENKCLVKIQSLENERLSQERNLGRVKDENDFLRTSVKQATDKFSYLEKEFSHSQKECSELCLKVKSLESQLATKSELCTDLRKTLEESKMKNLALENKLASNKAYVREQKEVLHELATDHKVLEASSADLKLRSAEADVYEKALEGHVSELEAICSILREQHDEQQKYFLQKETILKRDAKEKQRNLENENKKLGQQVQQLENELLNERAKFSNRARACKLAEERLRKNDESFVQLTEKFDLANHAIQIERATVEMLTRKNDDLSQEVLKLQNKLCHLEEKLSAHSINDEKAVDRKALAEIGNTVQQYFEGNASLTKKLENSWTAHNNDKLEECERQLDYERKRRLSAEMEASNLSVELEKAKVELAIYRNNANKSVKSSDSNGRRRRLLQNSFGHFSSTYSGSKSPIGHCNQRYSELLTKLPSPPNTVQESWRSTPLSGECNDQPMPSVIANGESVERESSVHSEHSSQSHGDAPEINSILSSSEISAPVSQRASQKMEEATRKALAMLNNSSS